jgi:uncharacterized protein with von Willebrand factor type A (vWA) domain
VGVTDGRVVLAVDCSLRLPIEDQWGRVKELATTMVALLEGHRDTKLITYAEVARVITAEELASLSWDFVYGTNLQQALRLGRDLLDEGDDPKRLIVITDAEPTAHCLPGGEVFFNYPPVYETTAATLEEAEKCSRSEVRVDFLLVRPDSPVRQVAERVAATCHGLVGICVGEASTLTGVEGFLGSIGLR